MRGGCEQHWVSQVAPALMHTPPPRLLFTHLRMLKTFKEAEWSVVHSVAPDEAVVGIEIPLDEAHSNPFTRQRCKPTRDRAK